MNEPTVSVVDLIGGFMVVVGVLTTVLNLDLRDARKAGQFGIAAFLVVNGLVLAAGGILLIEGWLWR